MTFHSLPKEDALDALKSRQTGLTNEEAAHGLARYGKNELTAAKKTSLAVKFLRQFLDPMIIVLIAAAVLSGTIAIVRHDYTELIDGGIILVIVIVNAVIGLVEENKAEAALEALKRLNKPYSKVKRAGNTIKILVETLTVGDIVLLEAGDIVPADLRLTAAASLKIEEAALTGESVPVTKDAEAICNAEAPLGDRRNMAFAGGTVTYGRGEGVVTAVGMDTEMGKIATMISETKSEASPLSRQLTKTAKILSIVVLAVAAVIFAVSALRGNDIMEAFMTAVAIAVAAVPEGLPAVVTIVLAFGVQRMAKRNAIIKNLPAVETLGCCEVICSDKTGTLTLNRMTVKETYSLAGREMLERVMSLCNDTVANADGDLLGDPTETALSAYTGIEAYTSTRTSYMRHSELPFDSVRKLMTTFNQTGNEIFAYTKGGTDEVLGRCNRLLTAEGIRPLTDSDKKTIAAINHKYAVRALRVLAAAYKESPDDPESDMIFVGLIGMIDPPRAEVKEAVTLCRRAGIKPIMITGDHADTAAAIAGEVGILDQGDRVMTGAEIDALSEADFNDIFENCSVFARVSPENKVRIVEAYRRKGKVVAMTGDGVNDAPSIKKADIGVGMGITGTEVSKEAADMILTDDNFATIVGAVEEGRKIYGNITKAVQFLLSANIAEVLCLFITTVLLNVQLLTPVMILWVNLVTDSFPALALGMEKTERDVMSLPPRRSNASLFKGRLGIDIIVQGCLQTALVLTSFVIGTYVINDGILHHEAAMTMAFVSLCMIQLVHSYNMRAQNNSILNRSILSNKYLNLSFLLGSALLLTVVLVPALQPFFSTYSLTAAEWAVSLGAALLMLPLTELYKLIMRKIENRIRIRKAS